MKTINIKLISKLYYSISKFILIISKKIIKPFYIFYVDDISIKILGFEVNDKNNPVNNKNHFISFLISSEYPIEFWTPYQVHNIENYIKAIKQNFIIKIIE